VHLHLGEDAVSGRVLDETNTLQRGAHLLIRDVGSLESHIVCDRPLDNRGGLVHEARGPPWRAQPGDHTRIGLEEPLHKIENSRLPRTGSPNDRRGLARRNREGHVVEDNLVVIAEPNPGKADRPAPVAVGVRRPSAVRRPQAQVDLAEPVTSRPGLLEGNISTENVLKTRGHHLEVHNEGDEAGHGGAAVSDLDSGY